MKKLTIVIGAILLAILSVGTVSAATNCTFTTVDTTWYLNGDCTTDTTLFIPDGFTLEGQGYSITAVDPAGGHFVGAVVKNAGATAYVNNLTVKTSALANVCDGGDNRLRGIMFEGASGAITHTTVLEINQGNSGCQEGNAIEIRNAPFDGTHPNTQVVEISNNYIDDYQKTGIVANGDVNVTVTNTYVGSADLDESLAANSIQFGFGASGAANNNTILGNDWDGASLEAATAVLVYSAGDVNIKHNEINGVGTDVGVYALFSNTVNIMNNTIKRDPDDAPKDIYGIGVYFYANSGKSKLVNNTFSGWISSYYGADLDNVNVTEP